MQLAMYKGQGNFFDVLIRLVTQSKYSHCELVIDGLCYSSSPRDGGVRMKFIDLSDGNWDVYDIEGDVTIALNWFIKNVGAKYDWIGAVFSVLPFRPYINTRYFCSEACAEMLSLENAASYKPKTLLNKVYLKKQPG